jgi:hypothetical protein
VQLEPGTARADAQKAARVQDYLSRYFEELEISVFWGTCEQFVAELRKRWEAARDAQ